MNVYALILFDVIFLLTVQTTSGLRSWLARYVAPYNDVRGTLPTEIDEQVVYIPCQLEPQQVLVARTSHLSNTGVTGMQPSGSLLTAPSR